MKTLAYLIALSISPAPLAVAAPTTCSLPEIASCIASDPAAAVQVLKDEFAKSQEPSLLTRIGKIYRDSSPPFRDPKAAASYFEQASAAGDGWAMLALADLLNKGDGVPRDQKRAEDLLNRAKASGLEGPAFYALGRLHLDQGKNVEAAADLDRAVRSGDQPWAMITLANLLAAGNGVPVDVKRAEELLQQARKLGLEGPASAALGRLHRQTGNTEQAAADLEQAVAAGDQPWAALTLAGMLVRGEGVPANLRRAEELQKLALALGLVGPASAALGNLHLKTGNLTAAAEDLRRATGAGDQPQAMIQLADLLATGKGVPQDLKEAEAVLREVVAKYDSPEAYPPLLAIVAQDYANEKAVENAIVLLREIAAKSPELAVQAAVKLSPNSKAAVVQALLREKSIYRGKIDGRLTMRTLAAIKTYCNSTHIKGCRAEAMPPSLIRELLSQS